MYVIESKGEHLAGNTDSQYKESDGHNVQPKSIRLSAGTKLRVLNEDYAFYFVEQGNEVADIKTMMK